MSVQQQSNTVETVKALFPKDLADMLYFDLTPSGEWVTVRPRQYLGSENFAKIASIVRSAGGEYVSAGKESHFRIPLQQEKAKELPSSYDEVHQMVMDLRNYVDKATEGILKKLVDLR